jgi:hypothetical protein
MAAMIEARITDPVTVERDVVSLMAQAGLDIGQLQSQSGHRTPGILLTHVNSRPSDVVKKLG